MSRAPQQVRLGYFGKLPTRSDFVKSADTHALAELLDRWLAATMTRLTADPRWKLRYDAMRPLHFAFVGTRSRHAVAGRLAASSDRSQRRFPFLAISALEIDDPAGFLPLSPVALAPLWDALTLGTEAVLAAHEPAQPLTALSATTLRVDPADAGHALALALYLEQNTLASLEAALAQQGLRVCARQAFLALGLLLQPFRWSGSTRLEKSLALPLPREPRERALVASLWLTLAAPFLRHADVELALFIAERDGAPQLVVGFSGAAPETLQGIVDPQYGAAQQITFDSTDWVEDVMAGDHKVLRLSACLEQDQLTLKTACALFHETFA